LEYLGAAEGTPLDVFTCLPEGDLMDALHDVTVDGTGISAIQRAGLIKHIRFIFSSCGLPAPALGGVVSDTTLAVPPAVPARSSSDQPLALQSIPADTVYLNQIVDQNLRAQTRMLSFAELGGYRAYYESVCGCGPPEGQEPSGEQLAGLKALIDSGRVPYVDFSVWNPLGPRMAKFRRTESSVLIGGEFVTRHIEGPSSYACWEDSWSLFSVGMISLGAATPGSLSAYAAGIKTLLRLFPGKWSLIHSTDLIVRTERWTKLREEFERCPPLGFNRAMPWDMIIAASSFGRDGFGAMWWQTQCVLPASVNAHTPITDGMPGSSSSSGGGNRPPRGEKRREVHDDSGVEVCMAYNNRTGACRNSGKCKAGRRHVCCICGGEHRATERHSSYRPFGGDDSKPDKGKGKGDKGKKGKGKKGKKDRNDNSDAAL